MWIRCCLDVWSIVSSLSSCVSSFIEYPTLKCVTVGEREELGVGLVLCECFVHCQQPEKIFWLSSDSFVHCQQPVRTFCLSSCT